MSLLHFSKWKTTAILGIVMLGVMFALPNVLKPEVSNKLPGFMQDTINLGLDLQGGAHMLLEVDVASVLENEARNQKGSAQQESEAAQNEASGAPSQDAVSRQEEEDVGPVHGRRR